ncbi:MAG: short chain dehydrogenase [Hyphomicrobiales bacterium]|nr:short chain dehydrogenase [Hyphomicrobiales bacterium]
MALEAGRRNVLVTGAARRIGGAVAQRLAQEGYGVALHTSARSAPDANALAAQIQAAGGRACVLVADLGSVAEVSRLTGAAREALGPLQALVNSASLYEPDAPAAFDPGMFDRLMAVNLRAPLQLAAAFAAQLAPNETGAIVNITDQKVWRLNPRYFTYTVGKSALWTATQTMAQAYAPRIRVNAVGPGPVLPNQVEGMAGFQHEAAAIPLGASIAPEEIADAVLWLINARSVTGQMIAVDGGQHLAWKTPDVPD